MRIVLLALGILFFLDACSTRNTGYKKTISLKPPKPYKQHTNPKQFNKTDFLAQILYQEYQKWKAIPYCYGGTDKNGVDCSALVQNIFFQAFGLQLPRTTKEQLRVGYPIPKSELQAGDLLFFKTAPNTLHSGIYYKDGDFIHASTKYGVTISNIHNPYWRAKYYHSRRVLP